MMDGQGRVDRECCLVILEMNLMTRKIVRYGRGFEWFFNWLREKCVIENLLWSGAVKEFSPDRFFQAAKIRKNEIYRSYI